MIAVVRDLRLSTVGAVCPLLAVAGFVSGIALMATSGVQVLIPETGSEGAEWVADVNNVGDAFVVGAWIGVDLSGLLGIVALLGFYDHLKAAGPVMVIAPRGRSRRPHAGHDLARRADCDCAGAG